jgi:hypothetical protein
MRTTALMITAAALLAAAPAAAQNETDATGAMPENTASGTVPGAGTMNNLDSDATVATGPTNGLTAGPGAAPATTQPGAVDTAYGEPTQRENNRFPWGLLGLLGLAGLLGRKRDRTDNRSDGPR